MAHFTRVHTDLEWTAVGYVTVASDWTGLGTNLFKAINGDKGGVWSPAAQIVINTGGLRVYGPTVVNYGGKLKTTSGSRFVLATNDWPKLGASHVGRTRVLLTPLLRRQSNPKYHWTPSLTYPGSIQSIACTVQGPEGLEQPKMAIPLRVHNGGTLSTVKLKFRVNGTRKTVPLATPRLRIVRSDVDGNLVPLMSTAGGADTNGYLPFPTPASAAAYVADNAVQTFTYTCDQNNVVDTSLYMYYAELIEEVGATELVELSTIDGITVRQRKPNFSFAIANPPVTSGVPTGLSGTGIAGNVMLVYAATDSRNNGIWYQAVGAWTRRDDLNDVTDFSPWWFASQQEITTTRKVWEYDYSATLKPTKIGDGGDADSSPIVIRERTGRGNIWHSLACTFTSIADMRPQ